MLLVDQFDTILGQTSKIQILRFLVNTYSECNGREIAGAIGLSHVKCHTALKELHQHGVVEMRHSGKSILYRLNLKNILVKKIIIPIFEKESQLKTTLQETILKNLKKLKPKSMILFGSFASNRARPDSDIDILIVAPRKKDIPLFKAGLEKAEINITIGFGNYLAPIVMDETEFKQRFRTKDKLIRNIAKEGKVLFGDAINDLIARDD